MKTKAELLKEAQQVQRGIDRHAEQYAEDEWHIFQMTNGLTDEQLEEYKDKA